MDIEDLRAICSKLPGTEEDIKWGADLCFCVAGKMYLVAGLDPGPIMAGFKASPEDFADLVEREGIGPGKYLARYHWVDVDDLGRLSAEEWQLYAQRAHALVVAKLSKKKRRELGLLED